MATPVELTHARAVLRAATDRSAALVASLPDLDVRLPRSDWTLGDTAAHLAIALQGFAGAAGGSDDEWRLLRTMIPATGNYADRLAGLNQNTISAQPRRSPLEASQAIKEAAAAFLEATASRSAADTIPTPWYGDGTTHTVLSATCLLVGEQVVHGYDMARAAHRRWPISPDQAIVIFEGVRRMMPLAVNPEAVRDLSVTYRLHLGRTSGFVVRVAGGAVTVDPPGPGRVDCHIAGTPRALLLVGYGRISQWRAIASGQLLAWGRKPWLGFRFVNLFFNP